MQQGKSNEECLEEEQVNDNEAKDKIKFFFENAENPHVDLTSCVILYSRVVFLLALRDNSKGLHCYVDERFLVNKEILHIICDYSNSNPVVFGLSSRVVDRISDREILLYECLKKHFFSSLCTKEIHFEFKFGDLAGMKLMYEIIQQMHCFETRRIVITSEDVLYNGKEDFVKKMKEFILRTKVEEVKYVPGLWCRPGPSWIEELRVVANIPLCDRDIPLESTVKSAAKSSKSI